MMCPSLNPLVTFKELEWAVLPLHPKFKSLVEALAAIGDDLLGELSLEDYLDRVVSMDAVRATTVLRGAAEKNVLVKDAFELGLAQLGVMQRATPLGGSAPGR